MAFARISILEHQVSDVLAANAVLGAVNHADDAAVAIGRYGALS